MGMTGHHGGSDEPALVDTVVMPLELDMTPTLAPPVASKMPADERETRELETAPLERGLKVRVTMGPLSGNPPVTAGLEMEK